MIKKFFSNLRNKMKDKKFRNYFAINTIIYTLSVGFIVSLFLVLVLQEQRDPSTNIRYLWVDLQKDHEPDNRKLEFSDKFEDKALWDYGLKYKIKENSDWNKKEILPSQLTLDEIKRNIKLKAWVDTELVSFVPFDDLGSVFLIYKYQEKNIFIYVIGFKKQDDLSLLETSEFENNNSILIETKNSELERTYFNGFFLDYEVSENYPTKWFLLVPQSKLVNFYTLNTDSRTSEPLKLNNAITLLNKDKKIEIFQPNVILLGTEMFENRMIDLAILEINFDSSEEARLFTNAELDNLSEKLQKPSFMSYNGERVVLKSYVNDEKIDFLVKPEWMHDFDYNYGAKINYWEKFLGKYKNQIYYDLRYANFHKYDESFGATVSNLNRLWILNNNYDPRDINNKESMYTPLAYNAGNWFETNPKDSTGAWDYFKQRSYATFHNLGKDTSFYNFDSIYGNNNKNQKNWYLKALIDFYPNIQTKLINELRNNDKYYYIGR